MQNLILKAVICNIVYYAQNFCKIVNLKKKKRFTTFTRVETSNVDTIDLQELGEWF